MVSLRNDRSSHRHDKSQEQVIHPRTCVRASHTRTHLEVSVAVLHEGDEEDVDGDERRREQRDGHGEDGRDAGAHLALIAALEVAHVDEGEQQRQLQTEDRAACQSQQ